MEYRVGDVVIGRLVPARVQVTHSRTQMCVDLIPGEITHERRIKQELNSSNKRNKLRFGGDVDAIVDGVQLLNERAVEVEPEGADHRVLRIGRSVKVLQLRGIAGSWVGGRRRQATDELADDPASEVEVDQAGRTESDGPGTLFVQRVHRFVELSVKRKAHGLQASET